MSDKYSSRIYREIKTGNIKRYSESYAEKWVRRELKTYSDTDAVKIFKQRVKDLRITKSNQAIYLQALSNYNKMAESNIDRYIASIPKGAFPQVMFDSKGNIKPQFQESYLTLLSNWIPEELPRARDLTLPNYINTDFKRLTSDLIKMQKPRYLKRRVSVYRENYRLAFITTFGYDIGDELITEINSLDDVQYMVFQQSDWSKINYVYSLDNVNKKLTEIRKAIDFARKF